MLVLSKRAGFCQDFGQLIYQNTIIFHVDHIQQLQQQQQTLNNKKKAKAKFHTTSKVS